MGMRRDQTRKELADFARLVVRSGYRNQAYVQVEVGNFVRAEVDDAQQADELTSRLLADAQAELRADLESWPRRTDNDALDAVLADLRQQGWLTLEYCEDHFDASGELKAHPEAVGVVFFTETDVWHAITDGMLELKVWHADTSNMVSADPELTQVLDALARHGLTALFDEGRVEVTFRWRRRPTS